MLLREGASELALMAKVCAQANAKALAWGALLKELTGETKERKFLKMVGKNYLDAEKDAPLLRELLTNSTPTPKQKKTASTRPFTFGLKPVFCGKFGIFAIKVPATLPTHPYTAKTIVGRSMDARLIASDEPLLRTCVLNITFFHLRLRERSSVC